MIIINTNINNYTNINEHCPSSPIPVSCQILELLSMFCESFSFLVFYSLSNDSSSTILSVAFLVSRPLSEMCRSVAKFVHSKEISSQPQGLQINHLNPQTIHSVSVKTVLNIRLPQFCFSLQTDIPCLCAIFLFHGAEGCIKKKTLNTCLVFFFR